MARSAAPPKPSLLDLLVKATASDLETIDAQIAEKEQALAEVGKKLAGEIAALQQLRKAIDCKVNGKPARSWFGRLLRAPLMFIATWRFARGVPLLSRLSFSLEMVRQLLR